ncbi:glycosyltransferase family 10 [Christiangramia sp.]|uniref:glycosyltransferase family 10 domain-containing protein n=1 Tax=Christiangramia sp. TaxID=1931228 RepID=UPI0026119837|nr:glycosyltransferase family 10 [Christiangramia sp.]
MINIYKIGHLPYTPFDQNFSKDDLLYLNKKGIKIISNKNKADIFVAGNHRSLKKFILKNPKRKNYLIWAQEPRFSTTSSSTFYPFFVFPKVLVMNTYTGDVFVNNVTYQEKRFLNKPKLDLLNKDFELSHRRVAALMSYYNGGKTSKLIVDGSNIDLIKKRSDIAHHLLSENMVDIYGQGWPKGISIEDSRFTDRHTRKKDILKNYNFNLCFENTVYPKYITEKIWESIENYCLPIYYGGSKSSIYEIFPRKSFIDYSEIENPEKLLDFIKNMSTEDFISRLNKCINVYNSFIEKPEKFWKETHKKMLDNIVKKCNYIINS